jgi:peptidoglycan/xylan/chitin deacetylase (PgdA/CDA1 family)
LTKEPHSVVIKQIMQNETLHEEILGRPMLKVLRPPYGAYGDRVGRIARQLGYEHVVMWSVDTGDWRPDIRTRAIVRRATGAPAGSIILMHCTRDATAKALPRIVRHYQRRGIEVVGLSQVLKGARGVGGKGVGEPYGG